MRQYSIRVVEEHGAIEAINSSLESFVCGLSPKDLLELEQILEVKRIESDKNDRFKESEIRNFQSLSSRENQVLTLIAKGYTRPEVAESLGITTNTVATHIASIYRKLDINSVAEATLHACRWGLVL